jgi:hypothetical protein
MALVFMVYKLRKWSQYHAIYEMVGTQQSTKITSFLQSKSRKEYLSSWNLKDKVEMSKKEDDKICPRADNNICNGFDIITYNF